MALILLLAVALVAGLGIVFAPLLFVAGGLFVLWAAGWLIRRSGRRWYAW